MNPREKLNDSDSFQEKKRQTRNFIEHLNIGELF